MVLWRRRNIFFRKASKIFDLSDVNSSPSKYSQDLLNWYNNKYLNFLSSEELIKS